MERVKREAGAQMSEDKRAMADRMAEFLVREGYGVKPKAGQDEGGAA